MKKSAVLLCALVMLSGCAAYKFQKGLAPYDKGYVVKRSGVTIPEYTLGKDNTVPDLDVAQDRFSRRKTTVEEFYKKMGIIKSPVKEVLWDPPVMMVKLVTGVFKLPFVGYERYKYNHDPVYKAKVDKEQDERFSAEQVRLKAIRTDMASYVEKDVENEPQRPAKVEIVTPPSPVVAKEEAKPAEVMPEAKPAPQEQVVQEEKTVSQPPEPVNAPVVAEAPVPEQPKPAPVQPKPKKVRPEAPLRGQPAAVIVAKPQKGLSPLRVQFSAGRSHSPNGSIIAYEWNFGDGDTSTKVSPVNTYYSTTFDPRQFTVTLTVTDSRGQTATTSTVVEVLNK